MLGVGVPRPAKAPERRPGGGLLSLAEPLVAIRGLHHSFGSGPLRKEILHDVSLDVAPGEIVIVTGPSGSGKTTLLTLMGGLRAIQQGSVRVLGHELCQASERALVRVRQQIGYIFQLHNLLDALSAVQNVLMGLPGGHGLRAREAEARARDMLGSVGLEAHLAKHPDQLSGGQKQRVAIARALVRRPRIILADEPTASLDRQSGRDVVDRLHALAKREGAAVLLVTHDNRILDIADRIVHLEEGRVSGFADAVLASAQRLLSTLAKSERAGEIVGQVESMTAERFKIFLEQVTGEAQHLLQTLEMGADDAFGVLLERVVEACTFKVGQLVSADRVSLLLADHERGELWSKVARSDGGQPLEIRIPLDSGISGYVCTTGTPVNLADAYESPLFNRDVDRRTGYRTRGVLAVPIRDRSGRPFAVLTCLNKAGDTAFDADDERTVAEFAASIGVILETWAETSRGYRRRPAQAVAAVGAV